MEEHLKNKERLETEWTALCAYEADPSATTIAQRVSSSIYYYWNYKKGFTSIYITFFIFSSLKIYRRTGVPTLCPMTMLELSSMNCRILQALII